MSAVIAVGRQPAHFLSDSGRTAVAFDRAGMQQLAAEHEWLRDRVARLELDNARLRSLIEANARPVRCQGFAAAPDPRGPVSPHPSLTQGP